VLAQASAVQAWVAPAKTDYAGVYRLVGGEKKKAEIRKIIDTATEDMTLIQGMARKRLYETTEPLAVLAIGFPEDRISVAYLGERPIVTTDGGKPIKWRNRLGDKASVSQKFESGALVQQYSGAMAGGKRKSVYRLSADGKKLKIRTVVTADLMPKPVIFETTYVRK
jgi:hypothetical protein